MEDEVKQAIDTDVYQEQVGMMEMVLDVDAISREVRQYREEYCHYLS